MPLFFPALFCEVGKLRERVGALRRCVLWHNITAVPHQHRRSARVCTGVSLGERSAPSLHSPHPLPPSSVTALLSPQLDKSEVATLGLPSTTSHGGSDTNISMDGAGAPQRTRAALEHLQQKILKVTEQIRVEQEARDDNVAEYLKLAHNADKQQASRIKQVFEKKNQKSAQTIAHLHKKLEHYHKKLKEIEQNGPARQPKDVLRDMQQGLKDVGANVRAGISGFGGGVVEGVKGGVSALTHTAVVSKPREFASLIRNKFGSADNIAHLKDTLDDGVGGHAEDTPTPRALSGSATLVSSPKYGSDDECSSATSGSGAGSNSGGAGGGGGGALLGPTMGSPRLDGHHHHHHHMHSSWDSLLEGLQEIKASQTHMEDAIEDMKGQLQSDYSYMTQCLQEERYRYERLEEQLNDLTELHQNEMTNLKQELASMEEKVAYQSYERARDIQEAVESCLTRITKLELQQQQQQVVQLEGVENANARALLGKLINVILALMAVLLVFVSTLANFITPLMKTRARVAATVLLTLLLFVLWKQWDFVELWLLPS
uniref:Transmembrane and coiled-coil domain family 2 n=1 Tax=Neolamprologus brichardi TaxID=32507 RepID=A0A3Q4GHB3_NEOBR